MTTKQLSVVIVDDEPVARARLRRLLAEHTDIVIIAECADGEEAVDAIRAHHPDLVFLDIQMPELNGFQVLESLPKEERPRVVFVTAYDRYALDAFAVEALDYLLKPFDAERLRVTLDRARSRIGARDTDIVGALKRLTELQHELRSAVSGAVPAAQPQYLERLSVKHEDRIYLLQVSEIDYCEAAANYVKVHAGARSFLIRETITDLARRLNPKMFARIHRSTIVNLDRIKEIHPWSWGDAIVIMRSGQELRMSRYYRDQLDLGTRA